MVPYSPFFLAIGILVHALIGMATGAVSGRLAAAVLAKNWRDLFRLRGICRNAFIGAVAFVGSLFVIAIVPVPTNTITYDFGETHVTSTMNRFQYPYRVAFSVAIILPAMCELFRRAANRYARV